MFLFVGDLWLVDNGIIFVLVGIDLCLGLWEVFGIIYVCGVCGMKEFLVFGMGCRLMDRVFCFLVCFVLDFFSFCWMNFICFLVSFFFVIDDVCCFLYLMIFVLFLLLFVCFFVMLFLFVMLFEFNFFVVRIKYGVILDVILIVVFKVNY